jgi:hypothetical protein
METPSPYNETRSLPARSQSTQVRLEIRSIEIAAVLTKRPEIADEELELIEMRYQRALAITDLEDLFAQGVLNCMWRR